MRKIVIMLLLMIATNIYAQTDGVSYQAIIRNPKINNPKNESSFANENVILKFTITNSENTKEYQETHNTTTDAYSMVNLVIGQGVPDYGIFNEIFWNGTPKQLKVEIQLNGNSFKTIAEQDLYFVPHAYHRDVIAEGWLTVDKQSTLKDSLTVKGHTLLENTLTVKEPTLLEQTLSVQDQSTLRDSLTVKGHTLLEKTLTVKEPTLLEHTLSVQDQSTLRDSLTVKGHTLLEKTLTVQRPTLLEETLTVQNQTTLKDSLTTKGHTFLENSLTVKGNSLLDKKLTVKGKTVFDINMGENDDDENKNSYPVLIKGSKQGLAIQVSPKYTNKDTQSHRGNNYVSFWNGDTMKGRIEGMGPTDGIITLNRDLEEVLNAAIDYFIEYQKRNVSILLGQGALLSPDDIIDSSLGAFVNFDSKKITQAVNFDYDFDLDISYPDFDFDYDFTFDFGFDKDKFENPISFNIPGGLDVESFYNVFSTNANKEINKIVGFIESNLNMNYGYDVKPELEFFQKIAAPSQGDIEAESMLYSNAYAKYINAVISLLTRVSNLVLVLTPANLNPVAVANAVINVVSAIISWRVAKYYGKKKLGVAFESGNGDYAEWLQRSSSLESLTYGDIVGVVGGKISKEFVDTNQFMVVSAAPLVLGNMPEKNKEHLFEKVAFMGQVPVKVFGEVRIGDYILPSGNGDGIGIAVHPENMMAKDYQRIVGVAWEEGKFKQELNIINVAVGINHNDMSNTIEKMQFTLNHIQKSLAKLDPDFMAHNYKVAIDNFEESELDHTVAWNHPSKLKKAFKVNYDFTTDLVLDVKKVLKDQGINLKEFPLIETILNNPTKADFYHSKLQSLISFMQTKQGEVSITN